MKLIILYILFLISPETYGGYQSTSAYLAPSRERAIQDRSETQYYRIGYSTRGLYEGTYNPSSGGSNRPGVRKVHGYTGDGTYVGDDNGNESDFWGDGYEYYWDDVDRCWYRKPTGSSNGWQKYVNDWGWLLGWHWSITDWYGGKTPPVNPVSQSYEENPVPINEDHRFLIFLTLSYVIYKTVKRKKVIFL